jgi:hypothetical protein
MKSENYIAGPRHPIIVCGQSSIPFSRLAVPATEFLKLPGVKSFDTSKGNSVGICWIYDLRCLRHDIIMGTTCFTLAEQLCLFLSIGAAGFEATDERDKIYALLGLVHGESLPTKLRPNYNYSADRVFWDYGIYILKETRNLDILACCSTSRLGLPSWVPDWKSGFPIRDFNLRKASCLRFLEGNSKIEVECMILNRIVRAFEPGNISVEFPEYLTLESKDPTQLKSISKESTRALMKNIIEVSNYLLAVETKMFGCKVLYAGFETSQLRNWISTIGVESGGEQIYRTLVNIDQFDPDDFDMLIQLCALCAILASTLRYAMYEDDHGNIERTTRYDVLPKPGDKICYIKGAKFKFILRPEADEWRLIGLARGYFPLSQTEVALGDLKSLKDPEIRDDYEKSLRSREFEDL